MRPAGGVARGRPPGGALPRPVADLPPELHVRHAVVARRDPAVDGRGRQVHRPAVARRHLLGRQPPAQAVPDGLQPRRGGGLVGVDPAPGGDEHRVRAQLRGADLVEDVRAALAAHRAVAAAAVAAARPRRQARAGRRQVGGGVHPLAAPGLRRRHEPVRRHLGAHRRGRPAQLPRDLPARCPALQHPLDRVPLVPGEPAVGPRDRLRGALPALSGHGVLRSPGAGRSGPQGIGFPYSSAHVRMNVGGVRMKLIFKVRVEGADGGRPQVDVHPERGRILWHGSLPTSLRRGCAYGTSTSLSQPRPAVTSGGSYLFSALGLGHSVCRCQNIGVATVQSSRWTFLND